MLRDLEKLKQRFLAPDIDLEIYFDDIVDAHERIWDMLENYKEVVEALEETNESVISHRVNDILRVLTSISVIVLPLTLIASIWGMNVGVPGEGDQTDFYVDRRRDGRDPGRDARLLPPSRLALKRSADGLDLRPASSIRGGSTSTAAITCARSRPPTRRSTSPRSWAAARPAGGSSGGAGAGRRGR